MYFPRFFFRVFRFFSAQNHQKTIFSPCSPRGFENNFFTIFPVFLKILSVEPLALVTLVGHGHGRPWPWPRHCLHLQSARPYRGPKKGFPFKMPKNVQQTFLAILGLPPKNVKKMSQSAFWGFLAASQKNVQKMSGKCPGAGVGAGKMSRKCQKNVPKMSRDIFQTFF